jgi:hypothetical protein
MPGFGDCKFCEGSGKCEECNSSGIDPHLNYPDTRCPHCEATGLCPECCGTGTAGWACELKGNVLVYGLL